MRTWAPNILRIFDLRNNFDRVTPIFWFFLLGAIITLIGIAMTSLKILIIGIFIILILIIYLAVWFKFN